MTSEPGKKAGKRTKRIKKILKALSVDMGGFPVKQALPLEDIRMLDPFLLLHHASIKYNPRQAAIQQGVGPHPHRGFSPVTFVIEGAVHHRDSRGNNQVAGKGELQWMNAGAGLIHSERPSNKLVEQGMKQEIIQLWINTPSKSKMVIPSYTHLAKENMILVDSPDGKIQNRLVAGKYGEVVQKNISTESDLMIFWTRGSKGGEQCICVPGGFNCMIYQIRGELKVNDSNIQKEELVILEKAGEFLDIKVVEDAEFLILCGDPINERVVQQGPFVMNSQTEILEAMRDYQIGKMGFLVED